MSSLTGTPSTTSATAVTLSSSSSSSSNNNKRTRLDRSLRIILPDANHTPSRRDGIAASTERLYRLYGSSIIQQSCEVLGTTTATIRPSTAITASVIWQRLYHCASFRALDVWASAMGALLCAAKTEEVPLTARQIIVVFHHLYRRRRLVLMDNINGLVGYNNHNRTNKNVIILTKQATTLSLAEKRQLLQREGVSPMSSTGPIWKEWFDALVQAEGIILRSLGFLLYWIPNEHAHRYVPGFCEALGFLDHDNDDYNNKDNGEGLIQEIWNVCNDAYRLDACVRYSGEVICTAAISLVLSKRTTTTTTTTTAVPTMSKESPISPSSWSSSSWWIPLIGAGREQDVVDCANLLASCTSRDYRHPKTTTTTTTTTDAEDDHVVASVAFLKPLVAESFNGPGSFVWEMAEGNL